MRLLDPRIQEFFWGTYLPARHGDVYACMLVDALDEAETVIGCCDGEVWVLRGIFVLSREPGTGATTAALTLALPGIDVLAALRALAVPGLIRSGQSAQGQAVWVASDEGRMLLAYHQNEDEPAAAGMRFLQGRAREGALAPWRPRRLPTQARRRQRDGR